MMLEDEFKEASKITGKSYEDITEYYALCKARLTEQIYTEYHYNEQQTEIREQALSYTRDYVWFDEKVIK
jgi:hypothetical protein